MNHDHQDLTTITTNELRDDHKAKLTEEELSKVTGGFLGSIFGNLAAKATDTKGNGQPTESLAFNFAKITYSPSPL